MRLAIVSPYTWTIPSGVNSHVTDLTDRLHNRGQDAWIIAPAGTINRPAKDLPDNFILAGRSVPVRSNGSVAYANVWPLMMRRMEGIFARYKFDLIHVHEPTIPSVGASATMVAKVPVVGTFHAAGEASGYYERWRPLAQRILASLTMRIAVSEAARDCVETHFPADYRVIPNGIDLAAYAPARGGGRVSGRVVFVGRPEPRKGLPIMIEAFLQLRKRLPHASLVLVGPTEEEYLAVLPPTYDEQSLLGIRALGHASHDMKVEELRQAEILCAPSLGGESFGLVLTEGLAAGLPVVASDIPGYNAVLGGGDLGVLVPPGDVPALEQALFSTLEDADLRHSLMENGSNWVERYSWDRVVDQVLETYAEALILGPRVVDASAVPVLGQIRHFFKRGK
jgi:phosphatidylinositol alpha-mannosyltransferase